MAGVKDEEITTNLLISGTEGNDNIQNTLDGATIQALGGNDIIYNRALNVIINAGDGDDSIGNHGGYNNENNLIDAGAGNDTIDNHANDLTLKGGAGNDYIYNGSYNISIDGGDDNDTIISESPSNNVTIKGGKGDDYIRFNSSARNALIEYHAGDGNDLIEGFHASDTLSIIGGSYSTTINGSDMIVKVGNEAITIKNAVSLNSVRINDKDIATNDSGNNDDKVASITQNGTTFYYASLQDAVNAISQNGGTIKLLEDTEGSLDFSNLKVTSISINLNGKTFTANDTIKLNKKNANINIFNGGTITSTNNVRTLFEVGDGRLLFSGSGTALAVDATNLASGGYIANVTGGQMRFNYNSDIYSNDSAIRNAGGELQISNNGRNTIKANVLLSSSDFPSAGLGYTFYLNGTIDGDLLLDSAALNAGALSRVVIKSDGAFTKNPAITSANFSNLIAQQVAGSDIYGLELPSNPNNDSYVASLIVNGAITYYTSLQDAMNAAAQSTTNGTLNLLKDCTGNLDFSNFVHSGKATSWSYFHANGGGGGNSGGNGDLHFLNGLFNGCSTVDGLSRFVVNLNGKTFTANDTIKLSNTSWIIIKNGNLTSTGNVSTLIENNGGELDLQAVNVDATKLTAGGYIASNNHGVLAFESDTSVNSNNLRIKSTGGQLRVGNTDNATIKADILISGSDLSGRETSVPQFIFGGGIIDGDLFLDSAAVNANILNRIGVSSYGTFTKNSAITKDNLGNLATYDDDGDGVFNVGLSGGSVDTGKNISNNTSNTVITGTAYNDTIYNNALNVTINAGDGNDSIGNHGGHQGANDLIDAGAGDDTIDNHVNDVTLRGGDGNDYIYNGDRVSIDGGAGDDTIVSDAGSKGITISGGKGNDSIKFTGSNQLIFYESGDGNDTISGFNTKSTLQIGGGSGIYSTQTSGSDLIVTVGDGSVVLKDAATLSTVNIDGVAKEENPLLIVGTEGADTITNTLDGATIQALGGNDFIRSDFSNVSIDAGTGNNYVKVDNWFAENVSVTTGDGDDTVFNISKNATINTGAGNDSVANASNALIDLGNGNDYIENNNGSNVTISGGLGNDSIRSNNSNSNVLFKYNEGDGNDSISGFNTKSTLQIGGGTGTYSAETVNNDIVLKVGNGSITLKDAANLSAVNIAGIKANPLLIVGTDNADKIVKAIEGATINALSGNDSIINYASSVSVDGGQGNDFIQNNGLRCSITGGNDDDTIENFGERSVINGNAGSDSIHNNALYATIYGGDDNDTIENFGKGSVIDGSAGSDSIHNNALYATIYGGDDNDAIENFGERSVINGSAGSDSIHNNALYATIYGGDDDDTIENFGKGSVIDGSVGSDSINNSALYATIYGGDDDDAIKSFGKGAIIVGGNGNDSILNFGESVSVDGGQGDDSIQNNGLSCSINGGTGSDTIHNNGGFYNVIDGGEGNDSLLNEGLYNTVIGGQDSDTIHNIGSNAIIFGGQGDDSIFNSGLSVSIDSGDDNDSIHNIGSDVIIFGGQGDDSIFNSGLSVSIDGGDGNDSIHNLHSSAMLIGGDGNDFIHSEGRENVSIDCGAGDDVIDLQGTDYIVRGGKGNDSVNVTIKLNRENNHDYIFEYARGDGNDVVSNHAIISLIDGATVDEVATDGSDLILKIGTGSITVKGIVNADGSFEVPTITPDNYEYYLGYEEITNNAAGQTINVLSQVYRKSRIQNTANKSTIIGGIGNDSLTNTGQKASIDMGGGNNYVENWSQDSTIRTGPGSDVVLLPTAENGRNYIDTGDGADFIYNNGPDSTINGGDGSDAIYGCQTATNSYFNGGRGNDTIHAEGENSKLNGDMDDDVLANGEEYDPELAEKREQALEEYKEYLRQNLKKNFEEFQSNDVLMDIVRNGTDSKYLQGDGSGLSEKAKTELVELVKAQYDFLSSADFNWTNSLNLRDVVERGQVIEGLMNDWKNGILSEESIAYYQERDALQFKKQFFDASPGLENRFPKVKAYLDSGGSLENLFVPDINKYPELSKYSYDEVDSALKRVGNATLSEALNVIDAVDTAEKISKVNDIAFNDDLSSQDKYVMGTTAAYDVLGAGLGFIATGALGVAGALGAFATAPVWVPIAAGVVITGAIGGSVALAKRNFINNVNTGNSRSISSRNYNLRHVDNQLMASYSNNIASEDASYDSFIRAYSNNRSMATKRNFDGVMLGSQGNDILVNDYRDSVLMDGGTENDTIENYNSSNVMILGGDGNDVIGNLNSPDVTIDGGTGDDTIGNLESNRVLINTGDGNNSVTNCEGSDVTILTGDGNNYIDNVGNNVSIQTGGGSDSIINMGNNVSIQSGGDSDIVWSMGDNVSIQTNVGNDSVKSFGNNVLIDLGVGDNSIHAEGEHFSVKTGDGNNSIETNFNLYTFIETGKGNDYFMNGGSNVTIDAGDGNNIINNIGDLNVISSGKDDDYLENIGDNNLIKLGDGDDFLELIGNSNSVNSGAGDDMILLYEGNNNTIDGGAGDDIIYLGSDTNIVVKYNLGDGNDTIYGFNETSRLQIGGGSGSFSSQTSGEDIIITVGDGNITLTDAASLSAVNIVGNEVFNPKWSLSGTTAIYGTSTETLIAVSNVKSTDGITIDNTKVILTDAALANRTSETISISGGNYKLALSADSQIKTSLEAVKSAATLTKSGNNHVYKSTAYGEWYSITDNAITYHAPIEGKTFTISGLSSAAKLTSNVIVADGETTAFKFKSAALNKKNVTITGRKFSVVLDSSVDITAEKIPESKTLTNGTLNYTAAGTGEFYAATSTGVEYTATKVGDKFTLDGIKSANGVTISGNKVTVSETALDITATKTYTVKLSSDNFTLNFKGNTSNAATSATLKDGKYTSAYTPAHFTGSGKEYKFVPATTPTTFTITGLNSSAKLDNNVTVSDKVVTVYKSALNQSDVTISKGYTLALGKDVTKSKTTAAAWSHSGSTATYKSKSTTAGYKLADNKISYVKASGGNALVTVSGVKSTSGLTLSGNVITVSSKSLNKSNVTISKGYTLKLSGAPTPKTTTAWKVSGTTATLQSTTSERYTLKSNKIVYTPKKVTAQVGLTGLAKGVKTSSLTLPAKNVLTLNSTVLGTKTTLKSNSGGYSIKLTGNMKGKTFVGTSGADKFNITAKNAKVLAGGGNDSVVSGSGADTLSGGAGNDTLTGGKGNDVFIYTAGKDVITDYASGDKISIGAAISKSTFSDSDAVFTIGKGTLTVKKAKGKKIAFVDAKGKSRTIIGGAQIFTNSSSSKVTLSSGVEVGDASERTKVINLTGNSLANSILGGSGADTLNGGKGNDSLLGGAGNDKLYGQAGADSLWGGAGNDSLYGGKGNDTFIYKPGEGTDRIFDYTAGDMLTILKSNGKSGGSFTSSKYSGGNLTLNITGGGAVIFDSVSKGDQFNINGKTYTLSGTKLK